MRPYFDINIGDIYASPLSGSDHVYTVVDKKDGLVQVESSYQHPALSPTNWRRPSHPTFRRRLFAAQQPREKKPLSCDLCQSPAVALVHIPGGCTCLAHEYQRRCRQHMMRLADTDPEFKVLENYGK